MEVQLDKLKGCDKVFKEKRSGVDAVGPSSSGAWNICERATLSW